LSKSAGSAKFINFDADQLRFLIGFLSLHLNN